MMATIEEAKALYEEWAEEANSGKRTPWIELDERAQWAWRRVVDKQTASLIGKALRWRLGRMALEALRRGQWLRPYLLLRMSLMVSERDDIPF